MLPTQSTVDPRHHSLVLPARLQTSLHEGCNTILRSDCAHLIEKLYACARAQVPTVYIR